MLASEARLTRHNKRQFQPKTADFKFVPVLNVTTIKYDVILKKYIVVVKIHTESESRVSL